MMRLLNSMRLSWRLAVSFALVSALFLLALFTSVQGLRSQTRATNEVRDMHVVAHDVDQLKYYNADVAAWQMGYLLDSYRYGAGASISEDGLNRKGFLADADALRTALGNVHENLLTDSEQAQLATVRDEWTKFFEI